MTSADVRDMLDLPTSDGHPRPAKKQKTVEKRPEGITRELFALLGERAPPVAITDHIKYKERPKSRHKAQPWEITPFTNPARKDGLILRHWRRKRDPNTTALPPATPASAETLGEPNDLSEAAQDSKPTQTEADYHFAKFDIRVDVPEYDDGQYEAHLTSDEWSREETDYLVNVAKDYDLRWIVIADRYDYQPENTPPEGESTAIVVPPKPRTMEDMKARYYEVAAKIMALHHPIPNMSTNEFDLHEKMTKFDPLQETTRKQLAEALLSRSPEEIKEEEILLGELKRIVTNEERFSQERRELYARLEAPQSSGNTAMYQSSQGLAQLMQTLLSADKNKKRRSLMGPNDGASSPAAGASGQNLSVQGDRSHRDSLGGASMKKNSVSGPSSQRQLTPREEIKFGVSHHERLTSGVQFRHERITKLAQAKSNVQATKVSAALAELQIPPRLVMPTAKVVAEYERLIGSIHTLLDVRKVSEKVEGEIKVLQAQKEAVEKKGEGGGDGTKMEVDTSSPQQASTPALAVEEQEADEEDAQAEEDTPAQEAQAEIEHAQADDDGEEDGEAEEDVEEEAEEEDEEEEDEEEEEEQASVDGEGEDEEPASGDDDAEAEGDEQDADEDGNEEAENAVEIERGSVAPSTRSGGGSRRPKRSASELSGVSDKSTKRQRK